LIGVEVSLIQLSITIVLVRDILRNVGFTVSMDLIFYTGLIIAVVFISSAIITYLIIDRFK